MLKREAPPGWVGPLSFPQPKPTTVAAHYTTLTNAPYALTPAAL
jgi:hypothetical protein